jgi:VanZ family protein
LGGSNLKKLAALAFFVFLVVVAYWADSGTMPAPLRLVYAFPNGDRLGHFVLYGVLAFLLNAALPGRRISIGRGSLPLGAFIAALFAALEELSQFFFPHRTPDLVDLACGWLGIAVVTYLQRMRRRPEKGLP